MVEEYTQTSYNETTQRLNSLEVNQLSPGDIEELLELFKKQNQMIEASKGRINEAICASHNPVCTKRLEMVLAILSPGTLYHNNPGEILK